MKDNFDQMEQRTRRYWYQDGLSEIIVGLLFLLLGGFFWLQACLPANSPAAILLSSGLVLVLVAGFFASRQAIRALKTRLVYPRSGYVAYRKPKRRRFWLNGLLAIIMAILVSALFTYAKVTLTWIPAWTGIILGAIWLVTASRIGLLRFYILAGLSALIGSILTLSGIDEYPGLALFYALNGLAMLVSGSLIFWQYLHNIQTYQEQSDEG